MGIVQIRITVLRLRPAERFNLGSIWLKFKVINFLLDSLWFKANNCTNIYTNQSTPPGIKFGNASGFVLNIPHYLKS